MSVTSRFALCALHRSAALLLAGTALTSPAAAQLASAPQMPRSRVLDVNNVDLVTGTYISPAAEISIGTDQSGVVFSEKLASGQWWISNFHIALETTATTATVTVGTETKTFNLSGSTYVPADADGSTLTFNSTTQNYTYTSRDGTAITIPNSSRRAASIKYPNGALFTLYYDTSTVSGPPAATFYRLRSIGTSNGHQVRLTYSLASMSNIANNYRAWATPASVKIVNNTSETCQASAASCTFTAGWPDLAFSGTLDLTVTSPSGDTRYTSVQYAPGFYRVTGIKRASSSTTDNTTISYDANNRVSQVVTDGRTWTYGYSLAAPQMTTTVTNPDNTQRVVVSNADLGVPLSVQDEIGRTTSYTYDSSGRLTRITQPEGNYVEYTYDARGNATQTKHVSKTPGTPANIVSSATYPASCANALTCNRPATSTDARGNVTDYTYDSTHGGVLTITRPAPTAGAVRPQTRFGYTSMQAYFKNSAGSVVASGVPTWHLSSVSECQTLASCTGGADEVKTTIGYGPQTAGTANSLYPVSVSKGSGNGSLTATTSYTYDAFGNVKFVDGPLSGTADRTRFDYDGSRRIWGVIGPDPDGSGPLRYRAQRVTFVADMAIKTELGTTGRQTNGAFATAWDSFVPLQQVETWYDVSGRKIRDVLKSGSTSYALTQYSYDAKGRLECTAQRMNPAAYASLPASACSLGAEGQYGPDRITKTVYNSANEVTQLQTAAGTTDAANERTLTYTNNGKLKTLKDAENNLTTYEYDGFDRLSKTRFPVATPKGANTSSTTDYEQLVYDVPNNLIGLRLRDGNGIVYAFDDLDRLTGKDLPGTEPDVAYGYDNLGRMTLASQTGNSFTFSYDALGRNLTQVGPQGTVTSAWDLAGRRTQLTYPGPGLYVNYDYLLTGEVTKIRENGAASGVGVLATYAYDDRGNRTSVTFGNGGVQNFTYDPVSRLTALTNNLVGTANDFTVSPITRNPASQITSALRTGDAYAWTGPSSENRGYTANGLNQYSAVSSTNFTYDAKGNLTSDGTSSFTYSGENLLLTGPNSSVLSYDPMMRLQQITSGSDTTRLAYDGLARIAEYTGANALQRRYVHGPGIDEPIVWYEGSGTTDRRFLSADERGSIISITDSAGGMLGINKYDEYGTPQLGAGGNNVNTGKFQYTGQAWLPEVGLYYYKARMYSPTLGRFLQTDPIGYADSPNPYAYVRSDPIGLVDPLGLEGDGGTIVVTGSKNRCPTGWVCGSVGPAILALGAELAQLAKDMDGGTSIQCPASAGTKFNSPTEAGVAGGRAAEAARAEKNDQRYEWGGRIVPLPGGGWTFSAPRQTIVPGGGQSIVPSKKSDAGWYHLHNVGDGDTLSPDDIEMTEKLAKTENMGPDVVTVLVADNGKIYSWRGRRGLNSRGNYEGRASCD